MRVLFLIATFIPLVLTVHAQRPTNQFTCQVQHKFAQTAFFLDIGESKVVNVNGWDITATVQRLDNQVEVSLRRVVNIMDATYQREARKNYPLNTKTLPVELEHSFGGATDIFSMVCYPREL